jgi:hypothetical protein
MLDKEYLLDKDKIDKQLKQHFFFEDQVKTKKRVKELAEVYTNEREVNNMLDLIPMKDKNGDFDDKKQISYTYLEPACGNGNFLHKILERKLKSIKNLTSYKHSSLKDFEYYILRSVSTIYGIDICPENVIQSKKRLFGIIESFFDFNRNTEDISKNFHNSILYILNKNIILGDTINKPENILISEFIIPQKYYFKERIFNFNKLGSNNYIEIDKVRFNKLGSI